MAAAADRVDRLTWVGHATVLLRIDGTSVLTDPMLRGWLGPLRRHGARPDLPWSPDAVLVSHLHRDHLDLPSLRRFPSGTPIVVPRGAASLVSKAGAVAVQEIGREETISIGPLAVTAVRALHEGRRNPWSSPAEALGFVIASSGRRVYFAGDTDAFPEMADLRPLDLALLPVWGWGPSVGSGHLDPPGAARALTLLRPRMAVPIHWGTFYPLGLRRLRPAPLSDPPLEFARRARELAPEVEVRVLRPGEMMDL